MFVIAEIGSVHDGSFGNALKAVDLAKWAGATHVKFQTHIAEAETLPDAPSPSYFMDETRYDYFERTAFTKEQWANLKRHCDEIGICFISSPFSIEAVELLTSIGVAEFKIPSGEVTNLPMLKKISEEKKHVFLSSGMSNWDELDQAVNAVSAGSSLTVMQCTSKYPCEPSDVGLNVMLEMSDRYKVPVGLSDHTLGYSAAVCATALGASVIEKHLTFSKRMYGSDAQHSLEPDEFRQFCRMIFEAKEIISNPVDKNDVTRFSEMKEIFEKSIVSALAIDKGEQINEKHLTFKKPGDGIPASMAEKLIGKTLVRTVKYNHKFNLDDFE